MKDMFKILTMFVFIGFCLIAYGNNNGVHATNDVNNNTNKSIPNDTTKIKKECDVELIANIEQNITKLSQKEILNFLMTISKSCENNVEFTEYYNEVLFSILNKYPVLFCKSMASIDTTKQQLICNELSAPVSDAIDLQEVKNSIEKADCTIDIKDMIMKAINIAISKYN